MTGRHQPQNIVRLCVDVDLLTNEPIGISFDRFDYDGSRRNIWTGEIEGGTAVEAFNICHYLAQERCEPFEVLTLFD